MLEERSDDEHQVLELLKSSNHADAMRILGRLRAGDDAHSVVDFALGSASAHLARGASSASTLPLGQSSAVGDEFSTPDSSTLDIVFPNILPYGANMGPLERMQQQDQALDACAGVTLPSFQTLA